METLEKPDTKVAAERLETPDWYALLEEAVQEPGQLAAAHKYFHQYSLANRWLASTQLRAAGLPLMPINTFKGWLGANRPVMKGQKASIALIMPVPVKFKKKDEDGEEKNEVKFTKFMLRNYWFHLGQTDGEAYVPEEVKSPDWGIEAAFDFLEITNVEFEFSGVSDTRLGYVNGRTMAVSPLERHQTFGKVREMARIVLGHTADTPSKSVPESPELRDVEADMTAYLCAATLGLSGIEESRMRLQANLEGGARMRIPDKCAHRAFAAADKIINAGYC